METDRLPALLAEITQRILAISDPDKIILFGSYARGEPDPNSDLDLLIVAPHVEATRQESIRMRRALRGLLIPIDVVVTTPQQLERYRDSVGLIYGSALRDGKVLYERASAS